MLNNNLFADKKIPGISSGDFIKAENAKNYSSFFIFAKHSLQYTGRSSLGLKGTFASHPQAAQVVVYISFWVLILVLRASRHSLQRWGSFTNPRSA